MGNCCQPSENNDLLLNEDNMPKEKRNDENSDFFDILRLNTNNSIDKLTATQQMGRTEELTKMEDEFFDLINYLRDYPQQFINLIEKYKNLVSLDPTKGTYFIVINDSRIDLNQGQEFFIECQNFLQTARPQKKLIRDDTLKIARPSRALSDEENDAYVTSYINKYIIGNENSGNKYTNINYMFDQNVSDVLFVIILNLIGVGSDNQIKANFMLSADYDSVGITIDKVDDENNIYCYYCIFGMANTE